MELLKDVVPVLALGGMGLILLIANLRDKKTEFHIRIIGISVGIFLLGFSYHAGTVLW